MSKLFLMVTAFFFSIGSYADLTGDDKGNGGDLLICINNNKVTYELLDIYEAREFYNLNLDYGPSNLNAMERVKHVLTRFEKVDSVRAKRYWTSAEEFMRIGEFKKDINLEDIPDSQHLYIPKNCKIEQLAIQNQDTFPPRPKFIVNKNLWDNLDSKNQAALILHEVVYKEAIEEGAQNSIRARYFHELIAANRISEFAKTDEQYSKFLYERIQLKSFFKLNFEVVMPLSYFHSNGVLRSGDARNTQTAEYEGYKFKLGKGESLFFYESGEPEQIEARSISPQSIHLGFKPLEVTSDGIHQLLHNVRFNGSKKMIELEGYGINFSVQNNKLSAYHVEYDQAKDRFCFRYPIVSTPFKLKKKTGGEVHIEYAPNSFPGTCVWIDSNDWVVE